jgi:hypothetical protein
MRAFPLSARVIALLHLNDLVNQNTGDTQARSGETFG